VAVPTASEKLCCGDAWPATELVVGIPGLPPNICPELGADASSISENDFGASLPVLEVGDEVAAAGIAAVPMFGPIAITVV
jgi:hypothetical protein